MVWLSAAFASLTGLCSPLLSAHVENDEGSEGYSGYVTDTNLGDSDVVAVGRGLWEIDQRQGECAEAVYGGEVEG